MKLRTVNQFYRPVKPLIRFFIKKVELKNTPDLGSIFKEPKLLWVANHGPALGPFGLAMGMSKLLHDHGAGERTPRAITAKDYYKTPIVRNLLTLITQVDRPMTLDDYVEDFNRSVMSDLLVMPEGEYSQFGDGLHLQPFRSHRFVELAMKADIPILITAHRGTHQWGKLKTFNGSLRDRIEKKGHELFGTPFVKASLAESNRIQIMQFPKKMESFEISLKLYWIPFKWKEIEHDPRKKQRILEVSENVQATLEDMLNQMNNQ